MQIVLDQPHRHGNRDQRCASALGRFSIENPRLRRELFEAAEDYAGIKARWWAAKGVPTDVRLGIGGNGNGPCDETVAGWTKTIDAVERAIKRDSPLGFIPFKWLVLDDRDIDEKHTIAVMVALKACAVAMGTLDAKQHPWS